MTGCVTTHVTGIKLRRCLLPGDTQTHGLSAYRVSKAGADKPGSELAVDRDVPAHFPRFVGESIKPQGILTESALVRGSRRR